MKNEKLIEQCAVMQDDAVYMYWFDLLKDRSARSGKLSMPNGSASALRLCNNLMITCAHAIRSQDVAKQTAFILDGRNENGKRSCKKFLLDPTQCYIRNTQLDYCVVALKGGDFQQELDYLPIAEPQKWAHIIHHPNGSEKKVSFRNNSIKKRKETSIYYTSFTDFGSSGAAIFDDNWNWIGLHIGRVSDPQRPRKFHLNKGIRADKIMEDLKNNTAYMNYNS